MTTPAGSWLALLVGATTLRLSLTDLYLRYVRATMRPWLVLAGAVLVAVGVLGLLNGRYREAGDADHGVPRVALLLLLPVLAVLLVAPAPLGSYTADRQGPAQGTGRRPPVALPAMRDGAVDLTLAELNDRLGVGQDLSSTPVRLIGFVTPDQRGGGGGFLLTRFQISCCAADARAAQVAVRDLTTGIPQRDTWVEVVGRAAGSDSGPTVEAQTIRRVNAPRDPYE